MLRTLTRSADVLGDLVVVSRDGGEVDPERVQVQVDALVAFCDPDGAKPAAEQPAAEAQAEEAEKAVEAVAEPATATESDGASLWRIVFRPFTTLYERGNEPAHMLRELSELGETRVTCDLSDLPPFAEIQPLEAYVGWEIELRTEAPESAIHEIFDFVEGDCELGIEHVPNGGQDTEEVGPEAPAPVETTAEPDGEVTAEKTIAAPSAPPQTPPATPTPPPASAAEKGAPRPLGKRLQPPRPPGTEEGAPPRQCAWISSGSTGSSTS